MPMEIKKYNVQKSLTQLLAFGLMSGFSWDGIHKQHNPFPGIDLEKEYELIKQKQSKLSANMRKKIVAYKEKQNE